MPITSLDPKTALIVIDLQNGIVGYPTVHPVSEVVKHAAELVDAFRRNAQPVIFVNVTGGAPGRTEQGRSRGESPPGFAEFIPELNVKPHDHKVTKRTWGAFTDTGLAEHLKTLSVTQVVLVGIATSIGVESTARQAHESGLHVTLAADAMTDINADAHFNSVNRIFPRLGEIGTTEEIIKLLDSRQA